MAHVNLAVGFEFWVEPVRWELVSNRLRPVQREGKPRQGDAWRMRDEFFHVKTGDTDGLLEFLNRWGLFWVYRPASLEEVWSVQEQSKHEVTRAAEGYLANESPIALFEMRSQYPHLFISRTDITTAIETTITLDFLQRLRFRLCARKDCRTPFAIESKHDGNSVRSIADTLKACEGADETKSKGETNE